MNLSIFFSKKPYRIRVSDHSVFVKWLKPIQQWSQEDGAAYLRSLQKAVRKTVDQETWQLISSPDFFNNPEYRNFVEKIRTKLIEEYHFQSQANDVRISTYHMGLLVLDFPASDEIKYPYCYYGVQLKPLKMA